MPVKQTPSFIYSRSITSIILFLVLPLVIASRALVGCRGTSHARETFSFIHLCLLNKLCLPVATLLCYVTLFWPGSRSWLKRGDVRSLEKVLFPLRDQIRISSLLVWYLGGLSLQGGSSWPLGLTSISPTTSSLSWKKKLTYT